MWYNKSMNRNDEKLTNDRIRSVVMHGILMAIVALLTLFASVPLPMGNGGAYLNAGDAAVYASAYVLGPWGGALVSALGSALADVLHGAVIYAPVTLVIKGLMALICGLLLKRMKRLPPVFAGLIMPVGYFAFEIILYGAETAFFGLWTNGIQYAFGTLAGILLIHALDNSGVVKFGRGALKSHSGKS